MANALNDKYELIEQLPATVGDFEGTALKAREITEPNVGAGRVVLLRQMPVEAELPSIREAAARAASIGRHPNILDFYGLTNLSGAPDIPAGAYIVTEHVRGLSLRERIRRIAPFSLVVAIDIAVAVAQAATAGADKGVSHGHLCAEQVVLTPEGQVRVADFALAQAIHDAAHTDHDVPGSDVKALGRIMYEMLTGMTAQTDGASPHEANSSVPPAIDGIVRKALSNDPRTKYAAMAPMLQDLTAARDDLKNGKSLSWNPMTGAAPKPSSGQLSHAAAEIAREQIAASAPKIIYEEPPAGGSWVSKLLAIVFAVVVLAVIGAVFILAKMISVPSDTIVPNMVGKAYPDAQDMAKANHFNLIVQKHDYSDTWPANTVMSQDIIAGRSIKSGKDVEIEISDGPTLSTVPDLTQMTTKRAKEMVVAAGLPVGVIASEYNDVIPVGIVTNQNPAPNAKVGHLTPVNITVSKGPSPPPAPTGLSGSATIQGEIDLSWNEVATASSYNIYRDGKKLFSGLPQSGYSDMHLGPSETHVYSVTAVNVNGESAQSEQVSATTLTENGTPPDQTAPPSEATPPPPSTNASPSAAPPAGVAPRQRQFHVSFVVPQGGSHHNIQIQVQDATGTNVVFDEIRDPGQTVDQTFTAFGNKVVLRIYVDGKLSSQTIEPIHGSSRHHRAPKTDADTSPTPLSTNKL